jgi:hypothetical protein
MTETPFRIGGYYKQRDGKVVQVLSESKYTGTNGGFYPRGVALTLASGGWRNVNGQCSSIANTPIESLDLLPGELHQINGEWVPRGVPVEDKPADLTDDQLEGLFDYGFVPPAPEPHRPALTWADSKRVDRLPGFVVERGAVKHDEYNPPERVLHPLQRIAQEGDQLHGSAFLRKG